MDARPAGKDFAFLSSQLFCVYMCKAKTQNFYKSLAWCTKCNQKINRIAQIDCKSRDESNESN